MMNRSFRVALLLAVAAMLTATACERAQPERLRELFSPRFGRVPPSIPAGAAVAALAADWKAGGREVVRAELWSMQGAALATALGVLLLAGWNRQSRPPRLSPDYLLLFLGGAWFFGAMQFFAHLRDPEYLWLKDLVFTLVVVTGLALIVRAVIAAARGSERALRPALPSAALAGFAVVLLAADMAVAFPLSPDDAGWFANLGGQRLRERGRLPYGDPLLTGTPGAAYGPLLFAVHVPFQLAISPRPLNRQSPARLDLNDDQHPYFLPSPRATQWCAVTFHLVGVLALFVGARRHSNARTALGMVCLYCGSLAVLGIGGRQESLAGMSFISHIAPASMTLVAFALLHRPAWSGVALVAAAGVGFYPIFMTPAWLGYYWRDRRALASFIAACAIASTVLFS
nr:hypothetical protein [Acidobacteriota bacterium]